jgi:hypothetical protein
VTERGANVGLNVDTATKLFTVVDLSTVWVVADLYERDFSRVRVGSEVAITTSARPDVTLRGRVSYIDPQVSADTRTAKVRIEVPNTSGELRLGMYADVVVTGASGTSTPRIPRNAVQNVGDRTVVYLANPKDPGKFVEREVRLGQTSGEQVEVVSGVQPGDIVQLPEADQVYVIGHVVQPRAIVLKDKVITVSWAIAMAGGAARDGKTSNIRIIREVDGGGKQEILVDLKAIRKRQAEDIALVPNDIVEVGASTSKTILSILQGAVPGAISQGVIRVIP